MTYLSLHTRQAHYWFSPQHQAENREINSNPIPQQLSIDRKPQTALKSPSWHAHLCPLPFSHFEFLVVQEDALISD